jgi:1,4-dihydroxy-2-naphthoyl-CoA hydrolase
MPGNDADNEAMIAMMPFAAKLGIALEEAGPERVVATLPWAPELCTTSGIMHGGALMSLADTVGALVVVIGLAEGEVTATITSTTQMFRPVISGTVRAVGVLLNRGRTTATAQTSLYDSDDRLISQTTQIQAIRRPPTSA